MKKVLFLALLLVIGICIGYIASRFLPEKVVIDETKPKKAILRVALVADSHSDNDLLAEALSQAQGRGVNFVIGLGDYSKVGTVEELKAAKDVFEGSGLRYYVTLGDRDEWASRSAGDEATKNFGEVFGQTSHEFELNGVKFVLVDNADIYKGISDDGWQQLEKGVTGIIGTTGLSSTARDTLTFVFAHKTPYHPQSAHVMGEQSQQVKSQADQLIKLIEQKGVDGFFSGDLHFFAKFNSLNGSVKMATIGAVTRAPNPQGPRFGVLTIWEDYSWIVEDIEIR